jgi:S-adenosylmethionine-diacylglycerol 3-amino-3-carboxypropyl transferase
MDQLHPQLAEEVDFSIIRYAQCWEDADVLLRALEVQPGEVCLSIASAGDNTLSLLAQDPGRVIAIDLSAAQLACLELRVAAYRHLDHEALLELLGVRPSDRRRALYARLAPSLSGAARAVWDARPMAIDTGIVRAGRFERYLELVRRYAINATHSRWQRDALFVRRPRAQRHAFYDRHWNNLRWRWLVRLLCSRLVMGHLGRDPRFFKYAEGSVSHRILDMTLHVLVDLDPVDNPYLHWIVQGDYGAVLPHALRAENFERIRANLDRLEWHLCDAQTYLDEAPPESIHRFNLSDLFEYLSEADSQRAFHSLARAGCRGGRLAYWNMLVPRHRPASLAARIQSMPELSRQLHKAANTFFYSDFVVEALL